MTSPQPTVIESGKLDLHTLVDLSEIGLRIDGEWYPYAPHWQWSLMTRSKFSSLYGEMLQLERKDTPNRKDQARFAEVQIQIKDIICPDLPTDVFIALPSDGMRSAIIIDFLTTSGEQAGKMIPQGHLSLMAALNSPLTRIGAQSSPGSKPATAVTKRSGSTSRDLSLIPTSETLEE